MDGGEGGDCEAGSLHHINRSTGFFDSIFFRKFSIWIITKSVVHNFMKACSLLKKCDKEDNY